MLLLVGSVATSARPKDGERSLGCAPQSGSAQPARPGPFCTGTLPQLLETEGHEARCVHQRVVTGNSLAAAGWRIIRGYYSPCEQAERSSPGSCTSPAAAGAGTGNGNARKMHPHLGRRSAERGGSGEVSPAHWTEDGPGEGQISSYCRSMRKGREGAAEGPSVSRASAAGYPGGPDGLGDADEASPTASHACSTSQREPSLKLGGFDRDHRKPVEPGHWTTARTLGECSAGVETYPPDIFSDSGSGRKRDHG